MVETTFKINEDVYVVQDYKIVKCRIEEIVIRQNAEKESVEYSVVPLAWEAQGKKQVKVFPEAYLVKVFDDAKFAALTNWENIYNNVQSSLLALEEKDFDIVTNDTK